MLNNLRDYFVEYALILVLIGIVILGVFVVIAGARANAEAQGACLRSGRAWIIDHYETQHIFHKIGNTLIDTPVQSPVYACVER